MCFSFAGGKRFRLLGLVVLRGWSRLDMGSLAGF